MGKKPSLKRALANLPLIDIRQRRPRDIRLLRDNGPSDVSAENGAHIVCVSLPVLFSVRYEERTMSRGRRLLFFTCLTCHTVWTAAFETGQEGMDGEPNGRSGKRTPDGRTPHRYRERCIEPSNELPCAIPNALTKL